MYSQILCCVSAKFFNILNATELGRTELREYEPREATKIMYDAINGESPEFEWNIFPGFTTLQLCDKISDLLSSMGQTPESFTGRILFMSMFNDIFCDRYDNKDECLRNANIVKTFAGRFGIGNGHLLDQVLRKSGILPNWNSQKADILSSVQRLHCPGVT